MSDYAPLRDAFSEINKLMLDKRQWDATHEKEMAEVGLKSRMLDMQIQRHNLEKKRLERQAQADEEAMRPTPVNIYNYFDNNDYIQRKIFDDSDAGIKFARVIGGPDAHVDRATGMVYDVNGNPVILPQAIGAQRAVLGQAVISSQLNPEEMLSINLESISAKQSQIEKELKATPVTDVAKRKALQEELSTVTTTKNKHTSMLDAKALEPYYRQQVRFAESMALKAAAMGVDDRTLATVQEAAKRANSNWITLQGRIVASEDKAAQRQLQKELKAMEAQTRKELKELEVGKERSNKVQQHSIVKVDDKGNPIPNTVEIMNVEKGETTVKPPSGYVFTEDIKAQEDRKNRMRSADKLPYAAIERSLTNRFQSVVKDDMGRVQNIIVPADTPRMMAAKGVLSKNYNNFTNPAEAVDFSFNAVIEAEKAIQEDAYVSVLEQMQKNPAIGKQIGEPSMKNPRFVDAVNNMLLQLSQVEDEDGNTFKDYFRYVPDVRHKDSLDRKNTQIVPEPEVEE